MFNIYEWLDIYFYIERERDPYLAFDTKSDYPVGHANEKCIRTNWGAFHSQEANTLQGAGLRNQEP